MTHDSLARRVNGQREFSRSWSARSRAEKKLWDAFRSGSQIDMHPNGKAGHSGRLATRRTVVRAEVIAAILRAGPGPDNRARLTLSGAHIIGPLDLSYARIDHPITLRDCVFDQPIVLVEARLGALTLDGSSLPGIDAPNLEVDGDLGLSNVSSSRTVQLAGAHFHRNVQLRGAHLRHGEDQEVALAADHLVVDGSMICSGFEVVGTVTMSGARVSGAVRVDDAQITVNGDQKVAFDGDEMTVGHDFNAEGLGAEGEVRLVDVGIASALRFGGAKLVNPSGFALRLDRAEISSSLYCDKGFTAVGKIAAIGAHVKGSVYLINAEVGRPVPVSDAAGMATGDIALRLVRTRIDGDLGCSDKFVAHGTIDLTRSSVAGDFRLDTTGLKGHPTAANLTNGRFSMLEIRGRPPVGFLDLTKAKADFLKDGPAARWESGDIILDEFEYGTIQITGVTIKQREQWLAHAMAASRRKSGGAHNAYLPQPYEQLAGAYRRAGNDRAARLIQHAKYRQRSRMTGWGRWYSKLWNILQDVAIGYGYKPLRALMWLLGLFVLGVLLFRYGARPYPIANVQHHTFTLNNSVGYTLDLLLPTSSLNERQVWQSASGWGEVAASSLVIFGWLLTATVFAAAARVLQRS